MTEHDSSTSRPRRRVLLGTALSIAVLAGVGIGLAAAADKSPATQAVHLAGGASPSGGPTTSRPGPAVDVAASPAVAVTRTSGNSHVKSDSPGSHVILRPCSRQPNAGEVTMCQPTDYLPDGSTVIMRCWVDNATAPAGYPSNEKRWFYVNEVSGGSHPGWSGYIYSAEIPVPEQILTPACTDQIVAAYEDPKYSPPPPLHFSVTGACTTAGGTLTGVSSGFTPGAQYSVSAAYPNGSRYPLTLTTGTTSATGSITWNWPCAGDPAGTYSTSIVDDGTGRSIDADFTINAAPVPATGPPQATYSAPKPLPTRPVASSTTPPRPVPTTTAPAPVSKPAAYTEQEGHLGVNTFTDPHNASGMGTKIAPGAYVQVSCKLYDPTIGSSNPDGYWYRIASSPWNGQYYSPANTFMNGDPWGGPYTHNTDWNVPNC